jgi:hypothetical protein
MIKFKGGLVQWDESWPTLRLICVMVALGGWEG